MTPYQAISEQAATRKLPRSFQTDLTEHDRQILSNRDPSKPFAWVLYTSGTHLFYDASICAILGRVYAAEPELYCYYWDGARLLAFDSLELLQEKMEEATLCRDCGEPLTDTGCPSCYRAQLDAWAAEARAASGQHR